MLWPVMLEPLPPTLFWLCRFSIVSLLRFILSLCLFFFCLGILWLFLTVQRPNFLIVFSSAQKTIRWYCGSSSF
jgi:hypothetical protein